MQCTAPGGTDPVRRDHCRRNHRLRRSCRREGACLPRTLTLVCALVVGCFDAAEHTCTSCDAEYAFNEMVHGLGNPTVVCGVSAGFETNLGHAFIAPLRVCSQRVDAPSPPPSADTHGAEQNTAGTWVAEGVTRCQPAHRGFACRDGRQQGKSAGVNTERELDSATLGRQSKARCLWSALAQLSSTDCKNAESGETVQW